MPNTVLCTCKVQRKKGIKMSATTFMAYLPAIIIGLVVATFVAVTVAIFSDRFAFGVIAFFFSFALIAGGLCAFKAWKFENTQTGALEYHTLESNYDGGIEREVIVYNIQGEIIERYQGKFDLTYDDNRIMFDDEDGKRHMIFYTTSNVIINEL